MIILESILILQLIKDIALLAIVSQLQQLFSICLQKNIKIWLNFHNSNLSTVQIQIKKLMGVMMVTWREDSNIPKKLVSFSKKITPIDLKLEIHSLAIRIWLKTNQLQNLKLVLLNSYLLEIARLYKHNWQKEML